MEQAGEEVRMRGVKDRKTLARYPGEGLSLRVRRLVGLSMRRRRVLSIAGVFLCGRREVPIPAICRARYVQGFRVSRQHRGMKAGDSSRRAFPSGAGNRGPRWSPSFRRPWPCGGCLARVVPSSLRPRCRPYVQTRAGTGTKGRGDDRWLSSGPPPAPADLVGPAGLDQDAQVPVKRGPRHPGDGH
jgi:hypothetical protein